MEAGRAGGRGSPDGGTGNREEAVRMGSGLVTWETRAGKGDQDFEPDDQEDGDHINQERALKR